MTTVNLKKSWNLVLQHKRLHCKEDVTKHTVMAQDPILCPVLQPFMPNHIPQCFRILRKKTVCHTRVLEESKHNDLPLRFSDPCIFLSGWHVSVAFKQLTSCLRTAHKDTRFILSKCTVICSTYPAVKFKGVSAAHFSSLQKNFMYFHCSTWDVVMSNGNIHPVHDHLRHTNVSQNILTCSTHSMIYFLHTPVPLL